MARTPALLFLLCLARACCPSVEHPEPEYPSDVKGWQSPDPITSEIRGSFVVKKGEEISNGQIRIKVVDLIPGNICDRGTEDGRTTVRLRFSSTRDQTTICEDGFPDRGSRQVTGGHCGDKLEGFGIGYIKINAVSLRDRWAYIVL